MEKYRTKIKDCQLHVRVKIPKDAVIDSREIDFFQKKILRGFLKPNQARWKCFDFSGPSCISIYDRLKKPISKYDFLFIIEQIIDSIQKLRSKSLYPEKVVWDINNSYINESTKELQLIYLPYSNQCNYGDDNDDVFDDDVFEYITSVAYLVKPISENDSDFASRFLFFLESLFGPYVLPVNLRFFESKIKEIENYIKKEDRSVVNTIKRQQSNSSGFITDKPKDYYEHYEEKEDPTGLLDEEEPTGLLRSDSEEDEATGLLSESEEPTGLLDNNDDETGLLMTDERTGLLQEDTTHYPILYRVLTEERISINKPVFRLGKENSYVDYFVSNNPMVSRSHADIVTRGVRYYIIDLNSKNKTYINDQMIPSQCEIEIFDGNTIRLGNEEFVFYV